MGLVVVLGVACSSDDDDSTGGGGAGKAGSHQAGTNSQAGDTQGGGAGKGSTGGDGGIGAEGGAPPIEHRCTQPISDSITGLVECSEGYQHRPTAKACEPTAERGAGGETGSTLPRAKGTERCNPREAGSGGQGGASPADCAQFAYGYCEEFYGGDGGASGLCRSGCVTDDDCGDGYICICDSNDSPTGGACQPSNCATDDDCGTGLLCASYEGTGCNPNGFACQTTQDTCQSSKDCSIGACNWDASSSRHFCDESDCQP
jgi:hypothetical protein